MTNMIYTKEAGSWKRKAHYRKQTDSPQLWKIANKKKGQNFGHYVKDPVAKYGIIQYYDRCLDRDYDFAS